MKTSAKKRILVSVAPGSSASLKALAKRARQPIATFAAKMIDAGLALEEDVALAARADERASRKGVKYVSHADAWATLLK